MDITALKYFIVTARTQNMTRAAELLNVTQPALSNAIRRLEESAGCELFVREGRGIRLNRYGEILLESALQVDRIMDECSKRLREEKEEREGNVRLACSASPTNEKMLAFLMDEGYRVNAQWIPPNWEEELSCGRIGLVLTFGTTKAERIEGMVLARYRIVVAAGKEHPLCRKPSVSMEDLNQAQFCCNSAPHSLTHVLLSSGLLAKFSPHIAFQGRTVSDLERLLRTGKYLCVMAARHPPVSGDIEVLRAEAFPAVMPFCLYWNRENTDPLLSEARKKIAAFYLSMEETEKA